MSRRTCSEFIEGKKCLDTYILLCNDKSYYIGITNDLKERLILHNIGKGSKYLLSKLPVKLLYYEEYPNKSEARKREIQLKGWTRIKKEKLIKGLLKKLPKEKN